MIDWNSASIIGAVHWLLQHVLTQRFALAAVQVENCNSLSQAKWSNRTIISVRSILNLVVTCRIDGKAALISRGKLSSCQTNINNEKIALNHKSIVVFVCDKPTESVWLTHSYNLRWRSLDLIGHVIFSSLISGAHRLVFRCYFTCLWWIIPGLSYKRI